MAGRGKKKNNKARGDRRTKNEEGQNVHNTRAARNSKNCNLFAIRKIQVVDFAALTRNPNRGFAIRNIDLIATIGLVLPTIESGGRRVLPGLR